MSKLRHPSRSQALRDYAWILIGATTLVLAALAVPLGALLSRRQRRRSARSEADLIEAEWALLTARLADIGVDAPTGATPRQAGSVLADAALLSDEPREAMTRVVATLERARYAPQGESVSARRERRSRGESPEAHTTFRDSRVIWNAALDGRRRADRVRAALLPVEGRRWWGGLPKRLRRGRSFRRGRD